MWKTTDSQGRRAEECKVRRGVGAGDGEARRLERVVEVPVRPGGP
jgi:hypothetical protein